MTGSASIIQDFLIENKVRTVHHFKIGILCFTLITGIVAIVFSNLVFVAYIASAFIGCLGVCVMVTWIKEKIKSSSLFYGLFIGAFGTFIIIIISLIKTGAVSPLYTIFSIILTLFGIILGSIIGGLKSRD